MIARYSTAIAIGASITLSLLFVMQTLSAIEAHDVEERDLRGVLKLVKVIEDTELRSMVLNAPKLEQLTATEMPPQWSPPTATKLSVGVPMNTQDPGNGDPIDITAGTSDGPLVTMLLVQPNYPVDAATRGIEGHVTVMFDVLADGSVANVTVVESTHRVFEREAIKAAHRARYRPRVVDGVALVTRGVRNRYKFELPD